MRVPVLINVSATLCATYSLLGLIYLLLLNIAAPGYFAALTGTPKMMLIAVGAVAMFGLSTAVGVLRRREWARIAILLLACIWIGAGSVSMWALVAMKNVSAIQFIIPASQILIGASWLQLFNAQRTKACFAHR